MPYNVSTAPPDPIVLNTWGPNSLAEFAVQSNASHAFAVWPSANLAIFVPFGVHRTFTVVKMLLYNGAAVSGNVDVGIYDTSGTRLVSSGSTLQAGTSTIQEFDVTDTTLAPGRYYMACAADNVTAQVARLSTGDAAMHTLIRMRERATSFALPADASSWVVETRTFIPTMGITRRTVI